MGPAKKSYGIVVGLRVTQEHRSVATPHGTNSRGKEQKLPDSIGWRAMVAVDYARQGMYKKARQQYHAAFGLSRVDSQTVMSTFKALFAQAAVDAALNTNTPGFQKLHHVTKQLWGEKVTWEVFQAEIIRRAVSAKQKNDHDQIWCLWSALADCRPSQMSRQTVYWHFWKATRIKVRRLRRPTAPVDSSNSEPVLARLH